VSNRRRATTARSHPRPAVEARQPPRARPFGGRARARRRSHDVLTRLHAMPRWVVPGATVVLVLVGMTASTVVGVLSLVALAAFMGWLAYLAWPELTAGGRTVRGAVLCLVVATALARATGLLA
jgi:hypothetical protein